ncbi:hypothetical protein PLICRDRAFT_330416 [Plicaturopsis crispa FD-325 SS-3]|uniref:Uncharacterized protein n=1 Tax=Plicaturopsis crispa FD-325 SS-3 TaxID=944288 RepID=A0A0C9T9W5_PLICR|nr:hypothetical protein PLICRDRAFT_330416 [Plicaturopsis crispa FD-325 SS-3]
MPVVRAFRNCQMPPCTPRPRPRHLLLRRLVTPHQVSRSMPPLPCSFGAVCLAVLGVFGLAAYMLGVYLSHTCTPYFEFILFSTTRYGRVRLACMCVPTTHCVFYTASSASAACARRHRRKFRLLHLGRDTPEVTRWGVSLTECTRRCRRF